jgi:hypothetical protein
MNSTLPLRVQPPVTIQTQRAVTRRAAKIGEGCTPLFCPHNNVCLSHNVVLSTQQRAAVSPPQWPRFVSPQRFVPATFCLQQRFVPSNVLSPTTLCLPTTNRLFRRPSNHHRRENAPASDHPQVRRGIVTVSVHIFCYLRLFPSARIRMLLGGAAVHRCDHTPIFKPALAAEDGAPFKPSFGLSGSPHYGYAGWRHLPQPETTTPRSISTIPNSITLPNVIPSEAGQAKRSRCPRFARVLCALTWVRRAPPFVW